MAAAAKNAPVPPQNLDAEECVIGAMLLSPFAIERTRDVLTPGDFYRESHGSIFAACAALHEEGHAVDAITLAERLDRDGILARVGGAEKVHELASLVPAVSNVGYYARIVREAAILRQLSQAGAEIASLAYDRRGLEVDDLVDYAQQTVFGLSRSAAADTFGDVGAAIRATYDRIVERSRDGRRITGLACGLKRLDELTTGLHPGQFIVAAGRPSMGKSGLALTIAAHIVTRTDPAPVALFTLEMSEEEVMQRLLSLTAAVDSQKLRTGHGIASDEWSKITHASGRIAEAPLHVDDSGLLTLSDLRAKVRRLKAKTPDLGLVIVDYLQLMTTGSSSESRVQEVSQISRGMKLLARETATPILALSQLSRQVEQRHDKRPMLQDLRESGSIEQDADLVWFLYRDEYYNPEDTDQHGIAELHVAKQRNGPTGTIKLSFVKRLVRFSDLPEE